MNKRIVSLILAAVMLFTLSAYGNKESVAPEKNDKNPKKTTSTGPVSVMENDNTEGKTHTGKKIGKEIIKASDFSEGLALVCVKGEDEKIYCINEPDCTTIRATL